MAQSNVSLSAGDQGNRVAYRASYGDLTRSASALAMVSGDSFLVARPEAIHLGPREAVRLSVRAESRRLTAGGRSLREPDSRNRSRQARFSPYPVPGVKLDLLRSVLQQRLIALGGVIAARISV
uniref:Chromosome 11 open reading frame 71 n=1 Tax=Microcebus murinus TaxID=30608 RepID=A0A8C5VKU4_MICMU